MWDFEDWDWETITLSRTAIYIRDFVKSENKLSEGRGNKGCGFFILFMVEN